MDAASIPASSGIYRIVCLITGRMYVGSSLDLQKRKRDHFSLLRRNAHTNKKLQHAFNKYGPDAFRFEIVELVLAPFLLEREQYWLDKIRPALNIARSTQSAHLGLKHSPASRAKMSARLRGRTAHNRGKKSSPEAIEKNRQAKLGKKASPATKEKMRVRMTGNTINQGRKHTTEYIEKLRQASTGRKASPETLAKRIGRKQSPSAIEKTRQAMIGNKHGLGKIPSPEKREKLRQAMTGKKHSLEQNEKHRQAMLGKPSPMLGKTHSPEAIEKMRVASTGQHHDPEEHASQMKTLIVTSPDGEVQVVHGVNRFCREHNLDVSCLLRVANGRVSQHKGWTARYP
jgi:group I intron endonuclease